MDSFNGVVHHSSDHELQHLLLEKVTVKVLICDVSARVVLTQIYTNVSETSTSRAKYVFPVPSRAAVCAFEMHADGRTIIGVSKEKSKAAAEHETAISEGKATGLLEWVTDDIFTISVGSIGAKQSITTKLVYVLDLMDDEVVDQVRFQLPMALGKRYGTPPPGIENTAAAASGTRLRITADIQMSGRIDKVSSPTHIIGPLIPYKTHLGRPSRRRTTVKFRSETFLQHDFVLTIQANGLDAPRCFAEERDSGGSGTIAMQLTIVPKFKLPPTPAQEFIFIVDRSGSMSGTRIETVKRTLKMLLRMLPSTLTTFNIVSFGSTADSLWVNSQNYTEDTLDYATQHVENMTADYGGTEIRSALAFALGTRNTRLPTVAFVLTDGEAMDIDNTIATVKSAVSAAPADAPLRIFTLGIGDTVSTAMCEGIARAGHGLCLLVVSSESIVGKCARLLRAGKSSILEDVSIDWGVPTQDALNGTARFVPPQDLSNGGPATIQISPAPAVQQTPHHIENIDPGMRFIVFVITTHRTIPTHITVRGRLRGSASPYTQSVPVDIVKPFQDETLGIPLVHTLAARRLITDFEDDRAPLPTASPGDSVDDIRKAVIIRLGEQYQLASRYTSFVGVEGVTPDAPGRGIRDIRGRLLRPRTRPIQQNDGINQESSSLAGTIVNNITAFFTFAMSFFSGGSPRGRPPLRVPGAFPSSHEPSPSPADSRDHSTISLSTLSSLDGSYSAWTSSRTPSPSPPPSVDEERVRSPSPPLESLYQAPVATQRQYGLGQQSMPQDSAATAGPVPPQIFDLVQLQSFDGSFPLNPSFGQIVGDDVLGRAAEFGADDKTWATALAVAYIRKHLSKQPDLLEGLLDKAMEYARDNANFSSLVAHAKLLVL